MHRLCHLRSELATRNFHRSSDWSFVAGPVYHTCADRSCISCCANSYRHVFLKCIAPPIYGYRTWFPSICYVRSFPDVWNFHRRAHPYEVRMSVPKRLLMTVPCIEIDSTLTLCVGSISRELNLCIADCSGCARRFSSSHQYSRRSSTNLQCKMGIHNSWNHIRSRRCRVRQCHPTYD